MQLIYIMLRVAKEVATSQHALQLFELIGSFADGVLTKAEELELEVRYHST